jgi:DNA-binding NarL/FixJ family response regulator
MAMTKAKVLIVDDHHVVVEGIRSALTDQAEFEVVGAAYNGLEAIEKTETLQPDIIIMDVSMPELNGIEATRRIKAAHDEIRIVIYTMHSG